MAPGEKRCAAALPGSARQQAAGLVALSRGTHLCRCCGSAYPGRTPAVPIVQGRRFWRAQRSATTQPEIAAQWHSALNGTLTPQMVTAGSHKRAWWECPNGHIWKAVIYSRAGPQRRGCPVCAGKVRPERQERYRRMLAEVEAKQGRSANSRPEQQIETRRNER